MKLGDFVGEVIHLTTGIEPCGGCNRRREQLNNFGDGLLNKIDVWRGRGKLEAMTYLVTVNSQKQYVVEAASDDEALSKISPENLVFSASTNNVRIQQSGSPSAAAPSGASVPA